jgi:hypothetical protein
MKRDLRPSYTNSFSRRSLLPRRPSATKHRPNKNIAEAEAIRHRSFVVGDLVIHRITTGEGRHKLSTLWEGPFVVAEVTRPGSYRLTQMDGTKIGNSWNIEHLRKFYPYQDFKSYWGSIVFCNWKIHHQ